MEDRKAQEPTSREAPLGHSPGVAFNSGSSIPKHSAGRVFPKLEVSSWELLAVPWESHPGTARCQAPVPCKEEKAALFPLLFMDPRGGPCGSSYAVPWGPALLLAASSFCPRVRQTLPATKTNAIRD